MKRSIASVKDLAEFFNVAIKHNASNTVLAGKFVATKVIIIHHLINTIGIASIPFHANIQRQRQDMLLDPVPCRSLRAVSQILQPSPHPGTAPREEAHLSQNR